MATEAAKRGINIAGPHPLPWSGATERRILLGCIGFGSLAGFETAEED